MTERRFIPGSQWLYLKIYTGHKSADDVLINRVAPFVKHLKEEGNIRKYFFIRYTDPEFHLRLRLDVDKDLISSNYGKIFTKLYNVFQPCMENNLTSNIVCETYKREIERYGNVTISVTEDIFNTDSDSIVSLLSKISEYDPASKEQARWQLSFLLIDDLLETFGFDNNMKINLLSRLSDNFKKEFNFVSSTYTKQLNDKYRDLRNDITQTLERRNQLLYPCVHILSSRYEQIGVFAQSIHDMLNYNASQITIESYLTSLIHMTMNRLFKSKNRIHEMVVYDFLHRYYVSAAAKMKYCQQNEVSIKNSQVNRDSAIDR